MKKGLFVLILFMALCLLFGCSNKEKSLVSVELDNTTIPTEITAYAFDLQTIKLICKYSDGSTESISLKKEFFDSDNLAKFNTIGSQTIAFLYNDNAYLLSINVSKGDPSLYIIESVDVTITTENNKYNVVAKTNKNIDIYAEANTNNDLLTATLTVYISPEFNYSESLVINCTLDGKTIDTTKKVINNSKVSLEFTDAFWSPLA